jgi:hypothetical protein
VIPIGRVVRGAVEKKAYRYYTFHISDSLAHIAISLTLERGDGDLYVNTFKADSSDAVSSGNGGREVHGETREVGSVRPVFSRDRDSLDSSDGSFTQAIPLSLSSSLTLPTMDSYIWKSIHFGDDTVQISYDDPHFCYDCDYIVGVYGYKNSTFSLLVTASDDAVAQLLPNHPLEVSLSYNSTARKNTNNNLS